MQLIGKGALLLLWSMSIGMGLPGDSVWWAWTGAQMVLNLGGARWNHQMGLRWSVGGPIGGAEGVVGGSVKINDACCREPLIQDHVGGPFGSHCCHGVLNLRV